MPIPVSKFPNLANLPVSKFTNRAHRAGMEDGIEGRKGTRMRGGKGASVGREGTAGQEKEREGRSGCRKGRKEVNTLPTG